MTSAPSASHALGMVPSLEVPAGDDIRSVGQPRAIAESHSGRDVSAADRAALDGNTVGVLLHESTCRRVLAVVDKDELALALVPLQPEIVNKVPHPRLHVAAARDYSDAGNLRDGPMPMCQLERGALNDGRAAGDAASESSGRDWCPLEGLVVYVAML